MQPYLTCIQGPRIIHHTVPGYSFYPPIQKGSCDNIASSTCVSKCEEWRSKCVLVHQHINGRWTKLGYRVVQYLYHTSCHHKQCPSIACSSGQTFDRSTCMCKSQCIPKTCPSGKHQSSSTCNCVCTPKHCGYNKQQNPTTCRCKCIPTPCPFNQPFNENTCRCQCRPDPCIAPAPEPGNNPTRRPSNPNPLIPIRRRRQGACPC